MKIFNYVLQVVLIPLSIVVFPVCKVISIAGAKRIPLIYKLSDFFGFEAVRAHYYKPVFNVNILDDKIFQEKNTYGIDYNIENQLTLLQSFKYLNELEEIKKESMYDFDNVNFGYGDSEVYYQMIRRFKPKRIIEIGSGFSTKIAKLASDKNIYEGYACDITCIEPFEMPWLDDLDVNVIRMKVEDLDLNFFHQLEEGDFLFIDSSHVVRTAGDVCHEYLKIIPSIKKGVYIHVHDIFLPYEYPKQWVVDERRYWTEQYLLHAYLCGNVSVEVVLSLNYLNSDYAEDIRNVCLPYLSGRQPGSFWFKSV